MTVIAEIAPQPPSSTSESAPPATPSSVPYYLAVAGVDSSLDSFVKDEPQFSLNDLCTNYVLFASSTPQESDTHRWTPSSLTRKIKKKAKYICVFRMCFMNQTLAASTCLCIRQNKVASVSMLISSPQQQQRRRRPPFMQEKLVKSRKNSNFYCSRL